jgi:hypothetical protein
MDITRIKPWDKRTKFTLGPCARRYVGTAYRRMLGEYTEGNTEHVLHATKGWRTRPVLPDGGAIAKLIMPPPAPRAPRYATTMSQADYLRGGNHRVGGNV